MTTETEDLMISVMRATVELLSVPHAVTAAGRETRNDILEKRRSHVVNGLATIMDAPNRAGLEVVSRWLRDGLEEIPICGYEPGELIRDDE